MQKPLSFAHNIQWCNENRYDWLVFFSENTACYTHPHNSVEGQSGKSSGLPWISDGKYKEKTQSCIVGVFDSMSLCLPLLLSPQATFKHATNIEMENFFVEKTFTTTSRTWYCWSSYYSLNRNTIVVMQTRWINQSNNNKIKIITTKWTRYNFSLFHV